MTAIKPTEGALITVRMVSVPSERNALDIACGLPAMPSVAHRVTFDGKSYDTIGVTHPDGTCDAWDLQTGEVVSIEI